MSDLQWNPAQVAAIMDRHDIVSRGELAKRLPRRLRATLYRSLDADWAGTAHVDVLVQMAVIFDVPIGRLVCDPRRRG